MGPRRTVRSGGHTMTMAAEDEVGTVDEDRYNFSGSVAVAVLIGAVLAWAARTGAVQLLVAIAALQALLAFAWMQVVRVPGRTGGLVVAALTAAGVDVAASVWPHSRLAAMLVVLALAVPVMFVHQLLRGAGRVRVGASLGGIALLVVAEASLPALLQLRHEFPAGALTGDAAFAVVVVVAAALAAGYFADMVAAVPRFDADVPRGLFGVVISTVVAAAVGHLLLRNAHDFEGGRGLFVGAALGVLAGLLAVGIAYVEHVTPLAEAGFARRVRPVLSTLVVLALVAPVGLLLCAAISR